MVVSVLVEVGRSFLIERSALRALDYKNGWSRSPITVVASVLVEVSCCFLIERSALRAPD